MKHVWIAVGVFALCLALGLMSLVSVRAAGAQTTTRLERALEAAQREDFDTAATALAHANAAWEGRQALLGIFLHHEEVDEIVALFAQLRAYARLQDKDDFLALCEELRARIEHVRGMELPTMENLM